MEAVVARKTWRTVEPVHGIVYFAPERDEIYDRLGLRRDQSYFVARAAAMGTVPPEVVIATFFNFRPDFVRRAMVDAWEITSPSNVLAARLDVVDRVLQRLLGDAARSEDVAEAASLARRAAERAAERPEGRPLFAGHASLPWPDESDPHLVLWHAQTLLREFRGDAHIAAMTAEGVGGCEALVIHAATGEVPASVLRSSRSWSRDEWDACVEALRSRGWLDGDGGLTADGRSHRERVEALTDERSTYAYEAIGDDGCDRLRTLARPLSKAIVASGELGFRAPG
ncbi:MAG TPA: hypothetical protein VM345_20345 [Acidimicrobiales bacterium]|jgi:hypothetical protein|nr:hypothetical protein [Acidimicrobiales bacterium]